MTIRSRKGELSYCKYLLPFMGLFRDDKKNNANEHNKVKESQLVGGEPVSYSTSKAEDLNPWLARTNPAGGQSGTWTRDPGLQVRRRPNRSATLPLNGLAFAVLCTNSEWRKLSLELNFLALLFIKL